MNGFMYKVARFFQGRYGIDKLFYGICGVAVVLSAANLFVRSLVLQLMVYAVLVLAVTFVLVNTLVDLLYAAVDPRVKYD